MINIFIRKGNLAIEDTTEEIFNWRHRSFFNISLGLEINEKLRTYISADRNEFQDLIKEITAYLKDEEIKFTVDSKVSEFIANIESQDSEFVEIKKSINRKVNTVSDLPAFNRPLKPYQIKGLEHLFRVKHGANFSVPGSGKTAVILAYYAKLKKEKLVDKLFVVGPFSSFAPWEDEARNCFGKKLNSARLVGPKRTSYYLQSSEYELFLCHYQTAANDRNLIIDLCNDNKILFVVDESHYVKRFTGGVWSDALLSIAPHATRRAILSGTPMPNGYLDLWSQMTFLWPGKQLLGERNFYKVRCDNPAMHEGIKTDIRPYFFRVKKSDLHLPKPRFKRTRFSLHPLQEQIYRALSVRLLSEMNLRIDDRQKLKQWRKAKMVRLLQAASNPTLLSKYSEEFEVPPMDSDGTPLVELIEKYSKYETPAKFNAAVILVKNLVESGKKVLLWTTFVHNIAMLKNSLKGINYYTIHGAVPRDDKQDQIFNREKQIRDFKATKEPSVLIANPAACAESISLHKVCHDAVYLDRTFNCGQFIQSLDRIHRIGLDRHELVNYHILIAKNTIDETIDRRLDEKHKTMIAVLEDEIPIGGLEVDDYEMEQNENEVRADFDATVKDINSFLKN